MTNAIEKTIQRISLERMRLQVFDDSIGYKRLKEIMKSMPYDSPLYVHAKINKELIDYFYDVLKSIYGSKKGYAFAHFYMYVHNESVYPWDSFGRYFHAIEMYRRDQEIEIERQFTHLDQLIQAEVNKIRKERINEIIKEKNK